MNSFEIEIKSLLGGRDQANALINKMRVKDKNLIQHEIHKQLNHYFVGGDLRTLYKNVEELLGAVDKQKFKDIAGKAKTFSVRTRQADKKILLVIKASVDDTTSSNGIARIEFESGIKGLTLDELDKLILKSGFKYQAKWSRERTEFKYRGANVSIDKNAGYGYLAEFEKVTDDQSSTNSIKQELRAMIDELGIEELSQDRLERMFAHYNSHWQDYYGTDKIFNID